MGRIDLFNIAFDREQPVFYVGEVMSGTVLLNLGEEVKMREIRLYVCGVSYVHWTEQQQTHHHHHRGAGLHHHHHGAGLHHHHHGAGLHHHHYGAGHHHHQHQTHTVHYSASETYFETTVILRKDAPDSFVLPPGNYTFPFQFVLSPTLPTSFEGGIGFVRYVIKVTIDRPWQFDDDIKTVFTVLSHLDLNREQNLLTPLSTGNEKNLCCLCCKSGPISIMLKLDCTGYVPGEGIPIYGECTNHSNRKMKATRATLMRRVIFHATAKSRQVTSALVTVEQGEIAPGGSVTWPGSLLPIPPCAPSGLRGCRIIDIDYYVEFSVEPAGPAFELQAILPVTIGTIPLMQAMSNYSSPNPSSSPFLADYPSLPPPSYESHFADSHNVRGADDSEHTRGDPMFAPAYPVYNRTTQPQSTQPNNSAAARPSGWTIS